MVLDALSRERRNRRGRRVDDDEDGRAGAAEQDPVYDSVGAVIRKYCPECGLVYDSVGALIHKYCLECGLDAGPNKRKRADEACRARLPSRTRCPKRGINARRPRDADQPGVWDRKDQAAIRLGQHLAAQATAEAAPDDYDYTPDLEDDPLPMTIQRWEDDPLPMTIERWES